MPTIWHADHLTSTTNTSHGQTSAQRYYPYGDKRGTNSVVTPYRYTGQHWEDAIGLYFYNARWYDAARRRFIQPDSIVPEPGNPQALNRYSYGLNNPVKYNDPTGHIAQDEETYAQGHVAELLTYGVHINQDWGWRSVQQAKPGETPGPVWHEGKWTLSELYDVMIAVQRTAQAVGGRDSFVEKFGNVTFTDFGESRNLKYLVTRVFSRRNDEGKLPEFWGLHLGGGHIGLYNDWQVDAPYVLTHELAHVWDSRTGHQPSRGLRQAVGEEQSHTDYGMTNAREDWAESLTVYVFPQYLPGPNKFGPMHRDYVSLKAR